MGIIVMIGNVRGYVGKDGTAWLNAEDVAHGWGFTTVAKSGNEVVRWARVNGYLKEFGFSPLVGKGDFLPENMVYRLGFKANNERAQTFQAKLADEILPAIRKHGGYLTPDKVEEILTDPDSIIRLATQLKEERAKREAAEKVIEEQRPKALFADAVSASKTSILIGALAKLIRQNGVDVGQKRLFEWLRKKGYLIKSGNDKNMPTQRSMEQGLFEVKEGSYVDGDGVNRITRTTKVTGKGQLYFVNKFLAKGVTV